MRAWIAFAIMCTACKGAPRLRPAPVLSGAERAAAGCYRVLVWSGPVAIIPTTDVLVDSAAGPPEAPRQRRWRPLPLTPSGRAIAVWSLFRDSVEVSLLEPQPGSSATGYGGRLGLNGDTLAGRLEPLRDFQTVVVDESGHRSMPPPNFRAVRVPCSARRAGERRPPNVSLLLTSDLWKRLRRNGDTSLAAELGRYAATTSEVMQPEERKRLQSDYERLFSELSAIIYRVDPVGLNLGENPDEYDPEARTLLPRLGECLSVEDVDRVVRDELARWFTPGIVARSPTCDQLVEEIWSWWQRVS